MLLLPLLVFGVDAGLTLFRRIVRGERWWEPHVQHAYQVWARRRGHGWVALALFLASAVAVALMLSVKESPFIVMMGAVGLSCVAACLAWWRLQQGPGPKAGEGG